jgi:pimeloyl-ACP methyl ester carboxylesterase
VSAGHHAFECDGLRYDIEISAACARGGCGLVVVQPTAPDGIIGPKITPGTDDEKVWRLVKEAVGAWSIDPRRVHVAGFSDGGGMTYRLACMHADEISSAAPVAAVGECSFRPPNAPSRPLSILAMNGVRDVFNDIADVRQEREQILQWLGPAKPTTVSQDAKHTHMRFESTANGNVFEFIEHDYAVPSMLLPVPTVEGHCIPGSDDLSPGLDHPMVFGCEPPTAFVWSDVVLDFFVAHPMR